ncbi:MAG TPA: sigma-70 family RNA polymerase sigma factor [Chitinophagaceae bacterium]|nr:sigma-70 family RNA polymerase sigma factor [Chitinophagaceae bacterium]
MTEAFNITKLTDQLFRHEAGKMVAVLTKIFGTENLQLSEDTVQDTFITAIRVWSLKGIPDNPSAWLFRAAKNKAIDILRKNKFSSQIDFSDPERTLLQSEYTLATVIEKLWQEDEIADDVLRMMYACCHPDIAEESQVTLMLKTLCGFSTTEIARAFVTSEDTVSKRLYRTREFFRAKKIKPAFPHPSQLKSATNAVLKTIYLLFNEGYNSTHAEELIRKDLINHAMYLCGLLCSSPHTQLPEVFAAMALMCFHAARINSRIDTQGEIILLSQQDRTKWNATLIEQGNDYMNKAAFGNDISSYHIEAAIAWEHCIAPVFEQTNWQHILSYYDMLAAINPSSVVLLNRLTVIFKVYGAEKTLVEIETSPFRKEWEKNYLFHSLMGDIYAGSNKATAKKFYETAAGLTKSDAEKKLLHKKTGQL